ncbi:LysM peptidoglycan-binding domain-containing protein [Rhodococcoides trifolii]|uniref:LysM peptidoglycan-binding domain-containing protein n=1 Tax=Rhodococcoides trifolii TaxID=908250 RepID=UPI001E38EA87|nr:LysM peptidoglycan-binding domain-containing protein [Rhodococcus trifolii]
MSEHDTLAALADRFYGDAGLYPVIAIANTLANPDVITVGQELLIPYVTYRHRVAPGDTMSALAQRFYGDASLYPVVASANHVADPNRIDVGTWLLVPELADVGHHTVTPGETLGELATRWYGEPSLYPVIAVANRLPDPDRIETGSVLIRPGLNRRYTVEPGDTLTHLAQYYMGDAGAANLLAAANHIADPNRIEVGRIVFFPEMIGF